MAGIEAIMHHRLRCSEVWGGIRNTDVEVTSATIDATLISTACEGGKGGDVYWFSVCDGDSLTRVMLADVVGHGEKVSPISQWMFEAMREKMNSLDGHEMLTDLNARAVERGLSAMATAGVAAFYRADSNLYFSYAGHHPALILGKNDRAWDSVESDRGEGLANLPLGIDGSVTFDQNARILHPGDRLLMYTDGVIEAPSHTGELFGLERLLEVLNSHARNSLTQIKHSVIESVRQHTGGSLAHDDVTLLLTEFR